MAKRRKTGAAIVRHDPFHRDALRAEPAQGAQQETCGGLLAFVLEHLDIGQPGRVIDGDMDEVPACAPVAAGPPCAGDAMARPVKTTQLLDIQVDQLARTVALIAAHGLWRIEMCKPPKPLPPEPARHGGPGQTELRCNRGPGQPQAAAKMQDERDRRSVQASRDAGGGACVV